MSRDQTVFSELAVAFGINNTLEGISGLDQISLNKYKREQLFRNNSTNKDLKNSEGQLIIAGKKIHDWLHNEKHINNINLEWSANIAPATGDTVAQDLIVRNTGTRISVKENAELFHNPSPTQVFEFWPKGIEFTRARSEDWFISIAYKELDAYFIACNGPQKTGQPNVKKYYENVTGTQTINGKSVKRRKAFTEYVKKLHNDNNLIAKNAYQVFCDAVSIRSAERFNINFQNTYQRDKNGSYDIHKLSSLISVFFKMDDFEYILTGTEKNNAFAVIVQDIQSWKKNFSVIGISAIPLQAGQPEVLIEFSFRNNFTKVDYKYGVQSQVRWSHGKFCGNPEGKLYRYGSWKYTELPWCQVL